jgi:hypothetical protein
MEIVKFKVHSGAIQKKGLVMSERCLIVKGATPRGKKNRQQI